LSKEPRAVLNSIWAFPPNRETFGGTAYFIVENSESASQIPSDALVDSSTSNLFNQVPQNRISRNVLIDCPVWDNHTQTFLQRYGGVQHLVITHRQGASPAAASIQHEFGCQVWVQEQEAYLLPEGVITSFRQSAQITAQIQTLWTPGYSPGSTCVYCAQQGGILFTGRHLLPDQHGNPRPLHTAKTFHWPRQLRSVQDLLTRFDDQSLHYLCPGANTGFLRQQRYIDSPYQKLQQLDLAQLSQDPVPQI
jgi:glyoxylase-like metal-dependent hydrolase (beta-lactamase superfamily II)